jgi:hypothetical protein
VCVLHSRLEEAFVIQVKLTPHRGYLRAAPEGSQETQKLFLLAQLTPQAGTARAPVALTFVVDTFKVDATNSSW